MVDCSNSFAIMPRPKRLNLPDIPQHIVQRGNNRQACFFADDDYRLYLNLLVAGCERHKCELHAFVLMTNHVHLLVTPRNPGGVSLLIRDMGRDYVRIVNRKRGRSGTMWEGRFKSSLIDNDHYCLACYRYIELNPVRAGMVPDPGCYAWSSYRFNALDGGAQYLTPHRSWLQLGRNNIARKRAYLRLFDTVLSHGNIDDIRFGLRKGLPVGSELFKKTIEQALFVNLGNGKRGRPRKS